MRWNALAMVVRANQAYGELGGHIASYASAAELFEVGFNHFFRRARRPRRRSGVLPAAFGARRLCARLSGRPAERSSSSRTTARRCGGATACARYPHPWLMPDFWQFPTGSMGIGPISAIYQARFMRYLAHRGLADTGSRQVWGVFGDGEMDEPESIGALTLAARETARQPDLRRQLQPAAPRRPGARQRPDHRGAGVAVRRRRLERDQGAVGHRLGRPVRARHAARAAAPLRRRPSTASSRPSPPRTATTTVEHFFGQDPELAARWSRT